MCIQKYIAKAENGMSRQDLPQLCLDAQIRARNQKVKDSKPDSKQSGHTSCHNPAGTTEHSTGSGRQFGTPL